MNQKTASETKILPKFQECDGLSWSFEGLIRYWVLKNFWVGAAPVILRIGNTFYCKWAILLELENTNAYLVWKVMRMCSWDKKKDVKKTVKYNAVTNRNSTKALQWGMNQRA